MGASRDPNSYEDIRHYLDQALESPRGIRVRFDTPALAHRARMNAYTVRSREVLASTKIWPDGHPNYGTSPYAALTLYRAKANGTRVAPTDMTEGNYLYIVPTVSLVKDDDIEEL